MWKGRLLKATGISIQQKRPFRGHLVASQAPESQTVPAKSNSGGTFGVFWVHFAWESRPPCIKKYSWTSEGKPPESTTMRREYTKRGQFTLFSNTLDQ